MKKYSTPTITEDSMQLESVYAASGSNQDVPIPPDDPIPDPPTEKPEWTAFVEWTNHDGGSHSDIGIRLSRSGPKPASAFQIKMTTSFQIGSISQVSAPGNVVCNYSDYELTIDVDNWCINPTQNGFISFQIIDKNSPYGGSYYPSQTHMYEEAPQFQVMKCESR